MISLHEDLYVFLHLLLNIYQREYMKQKLYRNIKHTFYFQYSSSASLTA